MSDIFFISDLHLGHKGVTEFLRADGTKVRPWNSTQEMDEALVHNWNSVVKPNDKVYNLGDVCINRKALKTLGLLNGKKRLIKGNHDIFRIEEYLEYFEDVRAYHVMDKILFSHMPVHPSQKRRYVHNVHGHLHELTIEDDTWYTCISVEQINFTPISYDDLKKRIYYDNA
jgi:calcineurin-like phosphoesterase family protein